MGAREFHSSCASVARNASLRRSASLRASSPSPALAPAWCRCTRTSGGCTRRSSPAHPPSRRIATCGRRACGSAPRCRLAVGDVEDAANVAEEPAGRVGARDGGVYGPAIRAVRPAQPILQAERFLPGAGVRKGPAVRPTMSPLVKSARRVALWTMNRHVSPHPYIPHCDSGRLAPVSAGVPSGRRQAQFFERQAQDVNFASAGDRPDCGASPTPFRPLLDFLTMWRERGVHCCSPSVPFAHLRAPPRPPSSLPPHKASPFLPAGPHHPVVAVDPSPAKRYSLGGRLQSFPATTSPSRSRATPPALVPARSSLCLVACGGSREWTARPTWTGESGSPRSTSSPSTPDGILRSTRRPAGHLGS
jgi:hypothetical protein